MEQQFITYKNAQIAFSSEGKGNAIVLLHGFLENSLMWKEIAPLLAKKKRVICIDLLGHGNSDCLGYVHSMTEIAESVKSVLRYLKIRRVTLIGHSMGGYVALAFAEKYLQNVKGICLVNSTAQADDEDRKKLRLRAIQMAKTNYKSLVSMSITNLFAQNARNKYLQEIEIVKKEAFKTSVQGYIACAEGMRLRPNRENILAYEGFKKLIIIGKQDPILNPDNLKRESEHTKTHFVELSGGHMSHIENRNELLEILNDFCIS